MSEQEMEKKKSKKKKKDKRRRSEDAQTFSDGDVRIEQINLDESANDDEEPPKKKKSKKSKKSKHHEEDLTIIETIPDDGSPTVDGEDERSRKRKHKKSKKDKKKRNSGEDGGDGKANNSFEGFLPEDPKRRLAVILDGSEYLSTSPLHAMLSTSRPLKKADWEKIRHRNLQVSTGRFTNEEDQLIIRNYDRFLEGLQLPNTDDVKLYTLGFNRFMSPHDKVKRSYYYKLCKRENFTLKLGKDLPTRTLQAVYQRARKMLSPLTKLGNLTKEERTEAIRLRVQCNLSFNQISTILNADCRSMYDLVHMSVNQKGIKFEKGLWKEDDDRRLVKCILQVLDITDIRQSFNYIIPWNEVTRKMGNRHHNSCRLRWSGRLRYNLDYVENKLLESGGMASENMNKARLIYVMYKEGKRLKQMNREEVDWDWIKDRFRYLGTFNRLMKLWTELTLLVPSNKSESFHRRIKWLYKHHFPTLNLTEPEIEAVKSFQKKASCS